MGAMNLQRQVEEIEAVGSVYPEAGALVFTDTENFVVEQTRLLPEGEVEKVWVDQQELSGTLSLLDCQLNGQPVGFRFRLPLQYPDKSPVLQVQCTADRQAHNKLTEAVAACLRSNQGTEVLLLASDALRQAATELHTRELAKHSQSQKDANSSPLVANSLRVTRKLVWFHHIKSITKRKRIVSWAQDLGIRGYSKPGFPGIVVCEGEASDVQEYWERLRAQRWQAISVRAEEAQDTSDGTTQESLRRFKHSFRELGEGDMDVLAAECRAAGLEHLFLAALKF